MKYIPILLSVSTLFMGCNSSTSVQHNDPESVSFQKTKSYKNNENKNVESTAIVVFKKGTTIQTAKEIIKSHGMYILKVYKSISTSTQKPMLHISSSLPIQKMLQVLHKDETS